MWRIQDATATIRPVDGEDLKTGLDEDMFSPSKIHQKTQHLREQLCPRTTGAPTKTIKEIRGCDL